MLHSDEIKRLSHQAAAEAARVSAQRAPSHADTQDIFIQAYEQVFDWIAKKLQQDIEEYNNIHAEMQTLFPNLQHAGPEEHLLKLKELKNRVDIPVIASLNCLFDVTWTEYAQELEKTGVDALELNFYAVPKDFEKEADTIVNEQVSLIRKVKGKIG